MCHLNGVRLQIVGSSVYLQGLKIFRLCQELIVFLSQLETSLLQFIVSSETNFCINSILYFTNLLLFCSRGSKSVIRISRLDFFLLST